MDGYSVTEAASVLGVPEGRVWELLARGVLSGTPEGESMRVFLKAQPAPIAPSSADPHRSERPRTNGNGGVHDNGEASAFRELLTEFRNLTERYGQALLALGEARGEVAGLRSRVELLEARLDLRLPGPAAEAAVPWTPPSTDAPQPMDRPEVMPATPRPAERSSATPQPARRGPAKRGAAKRGAAKRARIREATAGATSTPRPARARRPAVSGIAAALARAEDPTISDLTGAREEADALAALRAEAVAPIDLVDQNEEPTEEPEAFAAAELAIEAEPEANVEAEPLAEAEPAAEPAVAMEPMTIQPEPDWFADGDFAWLDAAEMERTVTPVSEIEAATDEFPDAPAADEPAPSMEAEDAGGQIAVEMAIPEMATPEVEAELEAELEAQPHDVADDRPIDDDGGDADPEHDDEPGDQGGDGTDDEPGWGASPTAAAAETEAEIQAAFDEAPNTPAAPTRTESEMQSALDESPSEPERPTAAALSHGDEVEVAVIDLVTPPMEDEPSGWGPTISEAPVVELRPAAHSPFGAVFSASDEVEAVEAVEAEEPADDVGEDAGAAELESASSWRPQSEDTRQPTAASPSGLQLSDAELAQLASDEGWDSSEVDAIRTLIGRGAPEPEPRGELPGADDLREALAALDAVPIEAGPTSSANDADEEWWRQPARPAFDPVGPETARQAAPSTPGRAFGSLGAEPDPDWLRRRRGPAANAYRRIRRLFTG
ncbi:MAG: hypothetical protein M3O78_05275 [Chloroflexota bacterium]|nr:hypothetical protein [Chloroflexota bacterium]